MSLATVLLFSGLAGIAIPIGAGLAYAEERQATQAHHHLHGAVIAFGGGILLGAVVFELVPVGVEALPVSWSALAVATGTAATMLLDEGIKRYSGPAAQLLALAIDYVPETIAFGALFGGETLEGQVFAGLIAIQNLPESYASFHEACEGRDSEPARVYARIAPLALLAPAAALLGFLFLGERRSVLGAITLFAAGGILYLVFQDIAPEAFEEGNWWSTATVTLGFLVALVLDGMFV